MTGFLDRATQTLREDGELDPARKRVLRQRVLASPKKKSAHVVRFILPVAAVLAAASVWAAASKRHVEPSVSELAAPRVTVAPVTPTLAVYAATTQVTADVPTPPPPVTVAKSKAQTPIVDDSERRGLRAYRDAERLQFTDKDYAAALEAWDRYLPLGGKSPLVIDARYDRALCLVHLGRRDEAREALGPFARGELGAYRQAEAQSLLDGMR